MRQGYSQINIDGQQVTTNFIGLGDDQPKFSRDAIAEFELVTNRFDATQGRSVGMQVNAMTKSGTNTYVGYRAELLPRRQASTRPTMSTPRASVLESADEHDVRRPDPEGPGPLLRQLRIRARAEDARLREPAIRAST